jgi:hypothetical protein
VKRLGSPYVSVRSRHWVKSKYPGMSYGPAQGRQRGGASMPILLGDLLLFLCLAARVTGLVIAIASLLT